MPIEIANDCRTQIMCESALPREFPEREAILTPGWEPKYEPQR
jgi:hypothetical protein